MIRVDAAARRLSGYGIDVACEIGRAGTIAADAKREGDGATPLGRWSLRGVLLRRDRLAAVRPEPVEGLPFSPIAPDRAVLRQAQHERNGRTALSPALPWRWIAPDDGWSDDPTDPAYNRPVTHPHPFSAERLWREDGAYDVVVVLGHNMDPPVPGRGSAVFLHCLEGRATAGCVAVDRDALLHLVARMRPADVLEIG